MKRKLIALFLTFNIACSLVSCEEAEPGGSGIPPQTETGEFRIIPKPQFISYGNNAMELKSDLTIGCSGSLEEETQVLKEALETDFKINPVVENSNRKADILLVLDASMSVKAEGGYKIEIGAGQIVVTAPDNLGIFYGIQTLRQAIVAGKDGLKVREATITDYPAHGWRSLMLDEARYFQGKEAVKKLLYEMAYLKYNMLQWHLTDDQGWRLEIKKYPLLIEKGSKRPRTGVAYWWNSSEFHEVPHEGHYTQDDIREIIEYADKLHIEIIPEVEILTHASAAVACYPYLGTLNINREVECRMGTFDEVMNIGNEQTIKFIHDVLDETAALFPGRYIHCGGDEIQGDHWKNSQDIQKLKSSLGISEDFELQRWFFNEISAYLATKGKKLMVWSDALGKPDKASNMPIKIAKGAVFQYWQGGMKELNFLLNNGFDVINAHTDGLYFNTTLPIAYRIECIPAGVDVSKRKQVLGLGVECWTEFDTTVNETFDHIFPLIAVYAETAWLKASDKDYHDFITRLQPQYAKWGDRGIYVGGTEETR